jgi:hypothetical protein
MEAAMQIFSKPTKEDVRDWLKRRQSSEMPPDRNRIRQELGWKLVEKPRALPQPGSGRSAQ